VGGRSKERGKWRDNTRRRERGREVRRRDKGKGRGSEGER
jgi:hypothetical protein